MLGLEVLDLDWEISGFIAKFFHFLDFLHGFP
jgi:hypothetical protein